jgi:hypothetical protein
MLKQDSSLPQETTKFSLSGRQLIPLHETDHHLQDSNFPHNKLAISQSKETV